MAVNLGLRQVLAVAVRQVRWLILLALLLASLSWTFGKKGPAEPLLPGEIDLQALSHHRPADLLWVDARSRAKYESRHIPGAVLLNNAEWESLVAEFYDRWQPEHQVIVYGEVDSDNASEVASRLREEAAIENVWVL
ncbi:MAG TPA: rhodanese-like domain-containing protein, partial [Terrimicrobiaceae bacterium]|nr:rhodanese-like domain-containing protein [Terrimicrobiaceae bacterium]